MKTWLTPVLLGALTLLTPPAASADGADGQRVQATINVRETFTPTSTPGVLVATLQGTGSGPSLGRLTFTATELIDFRQFGDPAFPNPRAVVTDGRFTLTTAQGSALTGTYDGVGTPDPARPGFVNGVALSTLTGGTGRFRCAQGFLPFTLDINAAAATEVITINSRATLRCDDDRDD